MKKKNWIIAALFLVFVALFFVPSSFAIYRYNNDGNLDVASAEWNVTLEQTGVNNNLTIVPEISNATYNLNVKSLSEVDIRYSVELSNIPSGVEVSIDGVNYSQASNGTIVFSNVGTILKTAENKTNTHTLTFRGASGATVVSNQVVTVNVLVEQIMPS